MSATINFRLAEQHDIPQLANLMNSQYAKRISHDYFFWQYFESAYPSIAVCAINNQKIIGMFGLQQRTLINNIKVGNTLDAVITPEFRGKGLFSKLYKKVTNYFNDLDVLCALANLNGRNVFRSLGWEIISNIDSIELSKEGLNKLDLSTNISCFKIQPKKEIVKFYYNSAIRKWRFDNHPDHQYSYVKISKNDFAIIKTFIEPLTNKKYGDIVDFECKTNNKNKLKKLFLKSIKELQSQEVEVITTWALHHTQLFNVLISLGFKNVSQERYLCLKILNTNYEYLKKMSTWHLVQADTEIY